MLWKPLWAVLRVVRALSQHGHCLYLMPRQIELHRIHLSSDYREVGFSFREETNQRGTVKTKRVMELESLKTDNKDFCSEVTWQSAGGLVNLEEG